MEISADQRLGKDRMLPLVFRMAMPAVAAQIVNLIYNIVDRIYIGHIETIGKDALAGVGVTSSVIILVAAFANLVGGGGGPLASIALGRGERDRATKILGNGFFLLVVFSVACTALPLIFMEPILRFAGASDVTMIYAKRYLSVYLLGTFFVMVATGLNVFISAEGRPGIAMISVLLGAGLNVLLDPLFIFVFRLNVMGAAIATVISQAVSAAFVLKILTSKKSVLRLSFSSMKPDGAIIKRMCALGISPFVMASTESIVGFALNGRLSYWGGDIYVSALAIMQSAMQIVSVPLTGFTQGIVPIISYNYGHRYNDRVRSCFRISLATVFTFNLVGFLLMIFFPAPVASLFTDDSELISTVAAYMPLFLSGMTIFGLQRCCQQTFVALGQAKVSLFIALLRKIFLLVPLAFLLPLVWSVKGVFAAEAIADATAATLCTIIFAFCFPKILKRNEMPELENL